MPDVCGHMNHGVPVEVRGQLMGVSSLLPPLGGFQGSNSVPGFCGKYMFLLSHHTVPFKVSFTSHVAFHLTCYISLLETLLFTVFVQLHHRWIWLAFISWKMN